ncbi:MAG: hypothetical protein ABIO36_08245, partial [Pyrinomonadaceae bacterium]
MNRPRPRQNRTIKNSVLALAAALLLLACLAAILWNAGRAGNDAAPLRYVATVAGVKGEFGEPFGIAVKGSDIYVSDGQSGKIWIL